MMYFTSIPRPQLGDVFVRYRDGGDYEEAQVICIHARAGSDWTATVIGSTGFEFVTGSPERRGFESWFPKGWVYDINTSSFRPPNTQWDMEKMEFTPADRGEAAPIAIPRPGDPMGALAPERPVPGLTDIPVPVDGEHHLAWRARVKRANPGADFENPRVVAAVKATWDSRHGVEKTSP